MDGGGPRSRVVNEHLKEDYKKKIIIEVFRSNL